MIKPIGYINERNIFFKELTPSDIFNATLIPVYTAEQLNIKETTNEQDTFNNTITD
jgi:hypothetical protein